MAPGVIGAYNLAGTDSRIDPYGGGSNIDSNVCNQNLSAQSLRINH